MPRTANFRICYRRAVKLVANSAYKEQPVNLRATDAPGLVCGGRTPPDVSQPVVLEEDG